MCLSLCTVFDIKHMQTSILDLNHNIQINFKASTVLSNKIQRLS